MAVGCAGVVIMCYERRYIWRGGTTSWKSIKS